MYSGYSLQGWVNLKAFDKKIFSGFEVPKIIEIS